MYVQNQWPSDSWRAGFVDKKVLGVGERKMTVNDE